MGGVVAAVILAIIILIIILFLIYVNHVVQSAAFGARSDGSPRLKYRTYKHYEELNATKISCKSNKGQTLNGYIYKNINNKNIKGLIVFFHGFSAGHTAYLDFIHYLTKDGYDVLSFDFTASCLSEGKAVKSLAQGDIDSRYIYDYVSKLDEYKDKKIISMGHSWGGHVAISFASNHQDLIYKCVSFAPFDSVNNLFLAILPNLKIIKPIFYLLNYMSIKRKNIKSAVKELNKIKIPTLYVSGDKDKTINKEYGLDLFINKVNNHFVEKYVLPNKGHQPYLTFAAQKYMEENLSFVPTKHKKKSVFTYKCLPLNYDLINEIDITVMKKVFKFLDE